MRRRRILQMGALLATLPLPGCGASAEPPKQAPASRQGGADKGPPAAEAPPGDGAHASTVENEGDAGAPPPEGGKPAAEEPKSTFTRVVTKIGRNHGHVLVVSIEDVKSGAAKTYDLTGTSSHPHSLSLSAEDMKTLVTGKILRMESNRESGHAHRVRIQCAPAVDPPEWVSACKVTFAGKDEHEMVIPAADVAARADKTYDIQGIAGHTHEVTVGASDFEKLAKGETVKIRSSHAATDGHTHLMYIEYKPPTKS